MVISLLMSCCLYLYILCCVSLIAEQFDFFLLGTSFFYLKLCSYSNAGKPWWGIIMLHPMGISRSTGKTMSGHGSVSLLVKPEEEMVASRTCSSKPVFWVIIVLSFKFSARQLKAVKIFPRATAGPLRPIVHGQTWSITWRTELAGDFLSRSSRWAFVSESCPCPNPLSLLGQISFFVNCETGNAVCWRSFVFLLTDCWVTNICCLSSPLPNATG